MKVSAHFLPPPPLLLQPRWIILAVTDVGKMVKAEFALTTETWEAENQPQWVEMMYMERGSLVWQYTTTSTPFVWVDGGTPPHPIDAGIGKLLTFQSGWAPKTVPGALRSMPGGRWGSWVKKAHIDHPGIEPRHFSLRIALSSAKVLKEVLEGQFLVFKAHVRVR